MKLFKITFGTFLVVALIASLATVKFPKVEEIELKQVTINL